MNNPEKIRDALLLVAQLLQSLGAGSDVEKLRTLASSINTTESPPPRS